MTCQVLRGCFSTNRILTIDLTLLKPYFHGTTSRSGLPFWLGSTSPYSPTPRIASGCIASSIRRPSRYRSEEHTSELQSLTNLVCRLLLEKKKNHTYSSREKCKPETTPQPIHR